MKHDESEWNFSIKKNVKTKPKKKYIEKFWLDNNRLIGGCELNIRSQAVAVAANKKKLTKILAIITNIESNIMIIVTATTTLFQSNSKVQVFSPLTKKKLENWKKWKIK